MKKIIVVSFSLLFLMLLSISFQGFSDHATTTKSNTLPSIIKIGFLYPKTGNLGPIGQGLLDGAIAGAYRINITQPNYKVQI